MAQRANITSLDAIQAFRINLVIFLSKARPALDEAASEVTRVRAWLETERRPYWRQQFLLRSQRLEEAEAALFRTKIASTSSATAMEQGVVQKARHAVAEAEDKLRSIKHWLRAYEARTGELLKQLEKLGSFLALDGPNAVAHLDEVIDTLQKYSGLVAPSGEPGAAAGPAPEGPAAEEAEGKKA